LEHGSADLVTITIILWRALGFRLACLLAQHTQRLRVAACTSSTQPRRLRPHETFGRHRALVTLQGGINLWLALLAGTRVSSTMRSVSDSSSCWPGSTNSALPNATLLRLSAVGVECRARAPSDRICARARYYRDASLRAITTAMNRHSGLPNQLEWTPRNAYRYDGLTTHHNHEFMDEPRFRAAYARAVQAAGWDLQTYWRSHVLLWAARTALPVAGDFVECGTARGFDSTAICHYLDWTDRPFYLLDTYTPEWVKPHSDERLAEYSPVCAHGPEQVRENFKEWTGCRVVVGIIPDTLTEVTSERIAFLHLDLNQPTPEAAAVRHFWQRLRSRRAQPPRGPRPRLPVPEAVPHLKTPSDRLAPSYARRCLLRVRRGP
jgi:Macrocin-O-methyltransferase (TylF)